MLYGNRRDRSPVFVDIGFYLKVGGAAPTCFICISLESYREFSILQHNRCLGSGVVIIRFNQLINSSR